MHTRHKSFCIRMYRGLSVTLRARRSSNRRNLPSGACVVFFKMVIFLSSLVSLVFMWLALDVPSNAYFSLFILFLSNKL